jgi:predicted RNase H-like HicB family nuclease
MRKFEMDYPIVIVPLAKEDGGGFMGYAPDLTGCMSDGESHEEALANTRLAILEWIDEARRQDLAVPQPFSSHMGRRSSFAAAFQGEGIEEQSWFVDRRHLG